jgi:prepilin-type processing-associated H-X9-DG protein
VKSLFIIRGRERGSLSECGWSRTDLFCSLATAFVLMLISAAALGKTSTHSASLTCLRNMQTLASAYEMYANDNQGLLVPNPDGSDAGMAAIKPAWGGGWIDYSQPDSTNTALLRGTYNSYGGRLGAYLPDVKVFRCPEDTSVATFSGKNYARSRSVSMNAYMGGVQSFNGNKLNLWVNKTFEVFQRKSDLVDVNPANLYVFIEERPESITDGNFHFDLIKCMDQYGGLTPGNFYIVDYPGIYHENGATLSFADGHTELLKWKDPRTTPPTPPSRILLNTSSPNNEDLGKLAIMTSRTK